MRASGEKCAFGCGLHWDLYLLCFARPHRLQTSVRCVPAIWSRIPQSTKKYPSRHPLGVKTPQSGQLPSLAFPAQTLATPTAFVLRSTTGGGTPGCMPLWHEPQARNSPGPRGFCVQEAQKWPRKRTMVFGRKPRARATLYCTCAKPIAKAKETDWRVCSYRKNGAVSSREKRRVGRGRRGTRTKNVARETAVGFVAPIQV